MQRRDEDCAHGSRHFQSNTLTGTCCTCEVIVWVGRLAVVAKRGDAVVGPWSWVWTVTAGLTLGGEDDKLRVGCVTVLGLPTGREFGSYRAIDAMYQFQTC